MRNESENFHLNFASPKDIFPKIRNSNIEYEMREFICEAYATYCLNPLDISQKIQDNLSQYKNSSKLTEKILYIFGNHYDELGISMKNKRKDQSRRSSGMKGNPHDTHKLAVLYYLQSVEKGHKYLWQTLPRALEIWFDMYGIDTKYDKAFENILLSLETYKIAHVLELLLSRYAHPSAGKIIFKLV